MTVAAADAPAGSPDEHREGQFWDEVEHKWRPFPAHGRWLGHWRHEFESMDKLELMMHVSAPAAMRRAFRKCTSVLTASGDCLNILEFRL